jgi:hypothetical protein
MKAAVECGTCTDVITSFHFERVALSSTRWLATCLSLKYKQAQASMRD